MTRILAQYVDFRARMTAANKSLVADQIKEITNELWNHLEMLLNGNFINIVMCLLRTDAKNYPLDVVLYPLFENAHQFMLVGRHKAENPPDVVIAIVTVLFYKHWLLMFTQNDDRRRHITSARASITRFFTKMPKFIDNRYDGLIRRVDDRIHHATIYRTNI